jgi:hypothetical protein
MLIAVAGWMNQPQQQAIEYAKRIESCESGLVGDGLG